MSVFNPSPTMRELTEEELKRQLDYDPETGVFVRKIANSNFIKEGDVAGSYNQNNYVQIAINNRMDLAHRLAWLYIKGAWPKKHIDHVNGNPSDNRLSNLREADDFQNQKNRGKSKRNTSGYKGVSWHKQYKKWQALCMVNRKQVYLGRFDTAEQAAEAYNVFAKQHHGDFYRSGQ